MPPFFALGALGAQRLRVSNPSCWCGPRTCSVAGGDPLLNDTGGGDGEPEEALCDHRHLEGTLKAGRAALDTIEAEVEAARVAADGAEARRVAMYLGRLLPHGCLGRVPLIVVALQTGKIGC